MKPTPAAVLASSAAALLSLGAPSLLAQGGNLVTNGGFELPVLGQAWEQRAPGVVFGSWTVDAVGQGVAHVGTFGNPLAVEGLQSLELNFFQPGGVSQAITTIPGRSYRLSFLMAGQTNIGPNVKHMRVDWNGSTIDTATWDRAATGGAWVAHSYHVIATAASTVVHFLGLETVDGGPYLDDVRVLPGCGQADVGSAGGLAGPDGLLDNNDFIAFIDLFFSANPLGDFGRAGGEPGADGQFDNNDFIVFITQFFEGC
jgi:hypothetical protein